MDSRSPLHRSRRRSGSAVTAHRLRILTPSRESPMTSKGTEMCLCPLPGIDVRSDMFRWRQQWRVNGSMPSRDRWPRLARAGACWDFYRPAADGTPHGSGGADFRIRPRPQGGHHQTHKQDHRAREKSHKKRNQDTKSAACIPSGKRCPAKKPRGKKVKKLSCNDCCQGSFTTDSTGTKICGCQPNGSACIDATATATSCSAKCSGCCDGSGTCQAGTSVLPVARAARPVPRAPATPHAGREEPALGAPASVNARPTRSVPGSGACLACDVCASGCPFTSVQAAINARPDQRHLFAICRGDYVGNLTLDARCGADRRQRRLHHADHAGRGRHLLDDHHSRSRAECDAEPDEHYRWRCVWYDAWQCRRGHPARGKGIDPDRLRDLPAIVRFQIGAGLQCPRWLLQHARWT